MSFLSTLASISQITQTVSAFSPFIQAIPKVGPIANTVLSAVIAAENLVTSAASGPVKKNISQAIVMAQHPGADPKSVSSIIDKMVAAMNALSGVLSTPVVAPAGN